MMVRCDMCGNDVPADLTLSVEIKDSLLGFRFCKNCQIEAMKEKAAFKSKVPVWIVIDEETNDAIVCDTENSAADKIAEFIEEYGKNSVKLYKSYRVKFKAIYYTKVETVDIDD